jgi:capsular exopolysaccharide synthesis family protein
MNNILIKIPKLDDPLNFEYNLLEIYKNLTIKLNLIKSKNICKSITILSEGPGEGKSTVLFNLARTCADSGMKVLIIDGDLANPSITKLTNIQNSLGLGEWLLDQISLDKLIKFTSILNLEILTAGEETFNDLLNKNNFYLLLKLCKHKYDIIFVDSPPIRLFKNAKIISEEVDMVLLIKEEELYLKYSIKCKDFLHNIAHKFFGVILNKTKL